MSDRIRERLESLLNEFRQEPAAIPEWLSAPDTVTFLRAWTQLPPDIGEPLFLGQPPMHRHNRWTYAWKYRRVDHVRLAAIARLPEALCRDMFSRLMSTRHIYPDGTLSRAASEIVSAANN